MNEKEQQSKTGTTEASQKEINIPINLFARVIDYLNGFFSEKAQDLRKELEDLELNKDYTRYKEIEKINNPHTEISFNELRTAIMAMRFHYEMLIIGPSFAERSKAKEIERIGRVLDDLLAFANENEEIKLEVIK